MVVVGVRVLEDGVNWRVAWGARGGEGARVCQWGSGVGRGRVSKGDGRLVK